jgi:Na+-driven multidrug efflux pump
MKADVAAKVSSFLNIRILGVIFLFIMLMQNAYLISLQQTKFLIVIALIESIINIVLDYALIFGNWGFPKLGFNGAAWASLLSEIVGMITVFSITKSIGIAQKFNIKLNFKFYIDKLKLVFIQGLPLMSQLAISCGAWWAFFILINRNYDNTEQAVSQAMRNLFGITGIFTWAFGSTSNTLISNLIGQGRADEIYFTIRKMCMISFTGIAVITLWLNLYPHIFLSIYGQGDKFISLGIDSVRVVSLALFATCIGVIWLNAVIATGKTKVVFWIEFIGISAYLIYILIAIEWVQMPIAGAWMSEWIYWVVILGLSYCYLKYGKWQDGLTYY